MLTKSEYKVVAVLLDQASDKFSNHGCNDLNDEVTKALSDEEKVTLLKEIAEWSSDPDLVGEDPTARRFDCLPDWLLMRFFVHKLEKMAQ